MGGLLSVWAALAWFQSREPARLNNCATVLEISTLCAAVQQRFYGRFGQLRLRFITRG
jgi:hypothetical protein